MAHAIKVMVAARKDVREAIRVTVMCWEKDMRSARKVTKHAVNVLERS
jgi:hypothetical protein